MWVKLKATTGFQNWNQEFFTMQGPESGKEGAIWQCAENSCFTNGFCIFFAYCNLPLGLEASAMPQQSKEGAALFLFLVS